MNARDMIAVLEYAKAFGKEKPMRPRKPKEKEFDVVAFINKERHKAKMLDDFFKEIEKINKKEDKKDEKKKDEMSFIHLVMVFMIGSMFQAPFMLYFAGKLTGKW